MCAVAFLDPTIGDLDIIGGAVKLLNIRLPFSKYLLSFSLPSTVAELCKWLVEKSIVPKDDAKDAIEKAERAAKLLPYAEDANRIIWELAQKCPQDAQEYVDFGYMTITRIDKDSVWLEGDDGGKEIGPIVLPKKTVQLLQLDWKINCALAKSSSKWHFAEVGNIYID